MKEIVSYLIDYSRHLDKKAFLFISLIVALLISLNYTIGIEKNIIASTSSWKTFLGFFALYTFAFCSAYALQQILTSERLPNSLFLFFLLLLSPAIFAGKVFYFDLAFDITSGIVSPWNEYWYTILKYPVKSLCIFFIITSIWILGKYQKPLVGFTTKNLSLRPYFILLALMIPLVGMAATQSDFLNAYPKVKNIAFILPYSENDFLYRILFEIGYGIDFVTIEFFFRGFVLLAFIKYAGRSAILPMAAFYCTIHFGKPLAECITSYFGGIILGVIVYHTRSIVGGLIVHLGIAWLMEVFGVLGNRV